MATLARRVWLAAFHGKTARVTLNFEPGSSAMAPRIALHEIDELFESRPMSSAKAECRTPA